MRYKHRRGSFAGDRRLGCRALHCVPWCILMVDPLKQIESVKGRMTSRSRNGTRSDESQPSCLKKKKQPAYTLRNRMFGWPCGETGLSHRHMPGLWTLGRERTRGVALGSQAYNTGTGSFRHQGIRAFRPQCDRVANATVIYGNSHSAIKLGGS